MARLPLRNLLKQLADASTGCAQLPVELEMEEEPVLPPEVRVAMYRIARRVLSSVARLAGATRAVLTLSTRAGQVELVVSVDGDLRQIPLLAVCPPLGAVRMDARAVGATLTIENRPGPSTRLVIGWRGSRA